MPAATKKVLVGLSVKLEVITKDKLRKFVFGVQKTQKGAIEAWSVDFELLDRATASAEFSRIVFLDVDLDLKKVAVKDVETTANKGLNKQQVEFVLSSVAEDAGRLKAGSIKDTRMRRTVSDLFASRNG